MREPSNLGRPVRLVGAIRFAFAFLSAIASHPTTPTHAHENENPKFGIGSADASLVRIFSVEVASRNSYLTSASHVLSHNISTSAIPAGMSPYHRLYNIWRTIRANPRTIEKHLIEAHLKKEGFFAMVGPDFEAELAVVQKRSLQKVAEHAVRILSARQSPLTEDYARALVKMLESFDRWKTAKVPWVDLHPHLLRLGINRDPSGTWTSSVAESFFEQVRALTDEDAALVGEWIQDSWKVFPPELQTRTPSDVQEKLGLTEPR